MKEITFTPGNFLPSNVYRASLILDGEEVDAIENLTSAPQTFSVTIPGVYIIKITNVTTGTCTKSITVQALFPLVNYNISDVNCDNNSYTFSVTLTNPTTAGSNIQYGWSFINDCGSVAQWTSNLNLTLPADSVTRYVFVRNSGCCYLIASTMEDPCVLCNITISNVSFNCNG